MPETNICNHKWNETDNALLKLMQKWHKENSAPPDNKYISKYAVHYFYETICKKCGKSRLFSAIFDRPDTENIPDEEFTWLSLFITQLNKECGYINEKKVLINDALDQLHWKHFPFVNLHNPKDNYFSISYRDDHFLRYNWNFPDALNMFGEMNKRAFEFLNPDYTEKLNIKLNKLNELKSRYHTIMEISSQSGINPELQSEFESLYKDFKKLSEEINLLI